MSAACGRSREGGLRGGRVHKVVRRMVPRVAWWGFGGLWRHRARGGVERRRWLEDAACKGTGPSSHRAADGVCVCAAGLLVLTLVGDARVAVAGDVAGIDCADHSCCSLCWAGVGWEEVWKGEGAEGEREHTDQCCDGVAGVADAIGKLPLLVCQDLGLRRTYKWGARRSCCGWLICRFLREDFPSFRCAHPQPPPAIRARSSPPTMALRRCANA